MSEIRAQAEAGDINFTLIVPTRADGASTVGLEEIVAAVVDGFKGVWAEAGGFFTEGDDEEAATGDTAEGA